MTEFSTRLMGSGAFVVGCRHNGETKAVDVDANTTVAGLKVLAESHFDVAPSSIGLSFEGRELLDDEQILPDAGIGAESVIIMHDVWHYSLEQLRELVALAKDGEETIIPIRRTISNGAIIKIASSSRGNECKHYQIINGRVYSYVLFTP